MIYLFLYKFIFDKGFELLIIMFGVFFFGLFLD